jgi:hypothetical protein
LRYSINSFVNQIALHMKSGSGGQMIEYR